MFNFISRWQLSLILFACLALPGMSAPASAEPMGMQELSVPDPEPPGLQLIRPYFGEGLDQPFDPERWRIDHAGDALADRPEIPTGIIASIGRFGLKISSSDGGAKVNGLAWSPSPLVSVVASGHIVGGIGANLTVRLGF